MKYEMRRGGNGYILTVTSNETHEAEGLVEAVYQDNYTDEIDCFADFLCYLDNEYGPVTSRYSPKRLRIVVEPGDKYLDGQEPEDVKQQRGTSPPDETGEADRRIRIFSYLNELDAFVVTDEYAHLAASLGLAEWHPAVWIGRLFAMDNDYGVHWLDNWELREEKATLFRVAKPDRLVGNKAEKRRLSGDMLMLIDPRRFMDGRDGPCHSDEIRKAFWTDVLKELALSVETLTAVARHANERRKTTHPEDYIENLEERLIQHFGRTPLNPV